MGEFPYRIGWYVPLIGSYLDPRPTRPADGAIAKAAKRHCNGTSVRTDQPADGACRRALR